MRDEEIQNGVFRDAEEWEHYKTMFSSLTSVMSQTGFSEEVSHQTDLKKIIVKKGTEQKPETYTFLLEYTRYFPIIRFWTCQFFFFSFSSNES